MKRQLVLCLGFLTMLSGCETDPSVPDRSKTAIAKKVSTLGLRNETPIPREAEKLLGQSTPCCTAFADFVFDELTPESTRVVTFDGSFPSFNFKKGKSFFAAFRLPKTNRPISLEIQSIAANDRLFAPHILVLNSDYDISREFGIDYFRYKTAGFLKGERLEANIDKIGGFKDEVFLIVYSPPERRAGSTVLLHPAKQFARTQNRVEPDIPDPIAKHSALGVITLFASTGQANDRPSKPLSIPKEQGIAPEIYVNQKIEQAVAEGNIAEAMSLVEDAEANGSTTARETFIDAVKARQQQ